MASFGNVSAMGLILLASVAVMAFGRVIEEKVGLSPAVSPGPSSIEYDVPDTETLPPYYEHLRECVTKVPKGCGPQIFGYLFNESATVASYCCQNMGSVGMACHKALSNYVAGIPEFSGKEQQILSRAAEILKKCPSPKPF